MITIFFPVYDDKQPLDRVLKAFATSTSNDFKLIIANFCNRPVPKIDELDYTVENLELDIRAKVFNYIINKYGGDIFIALPPYIIPEYNFIENFTKVFKDSIYGIAYSDYYQELEDGLSKVELFDWEGQIEERFDFGYIKAYRVAYLKEMGLFDENLKIMEDYDMWLKITDKYKIAHIKFFLYSTVKPEEKKVDDDLSKKLFSPGGSGLGQFSYLFYPPEMEKETKEVFFAMLKRREAFLEHENWEVDYSNARYEVMASVVIPVLNREKYIGNAIQKVLDGTFDDFEIIVVDNGSIDRTCEIVESFTDKRVRLIRNNGKSIADALNRGIKESKGKYICQLDSDDEYLPETLECMVGHLESHPKCGLAISYYELMDEAGNPLPELGVIKHLEYDRNNILRTDGAGALRVFPKVVLEEFGLYDAEHYGNFGEDYDMVLKVSEKYDVDRVHKVLYRYRRHDDNTDVTREPLMKVRNKLHARLSALKRRQELNKRLKAGK